jgi:hypothetical protein
LDGGNPRKPSWEESNMETRRTFACIVVACLLALTPAGAAEKWLHIHVEENGEQGETVKVNIPLDIVERMLPLISADELRDGKVNLEIDDDFEGIDLRELAAALRDAPDADFVTVEGGDESVRVAKEGDFLVVRAEERGRHADETVRVRLPIAVVDALVGDDPNELDLVAALRALGEYEGESFVDVKSDDSSVRIWIDTSESGSHR